jgi:hypothetical protein
MFQRNRHDLLEGIRRKCANKPTASDSGSQAGGRSGSASDANGVDMNQLSINHGQISDIMSQMEKLKHRLDTAIQLQEETAENLRRITLHCETLSNELQETYHGIATRDKLMNQIVQYLIDSRPGK